MNKGGINMKSGVTTWHCTECNKDIVQNNYSWLFIDSLLFDISTYYHCKFKHGKTIGRTSVIAIRLLFFIPLAILNVITVILLLITYPFWALHEYLG